MNRLRFLIARTLRQEAPLAEMSVPQADLLAAFKGQTVALVGNARGLADAQHGDAIEYADLVIRVNRAPRPFAASHGSRTDILALAVGMDAGALADVNPRRVLWMSHKRKRLPWHVARRPGFYLHPLSDFARLSAELGAPPTTGAMMIDLLARSDAARIDLYGFDFFASLSLSGNRRAADVPHDFAAEAAFVADLIADDPRVTLHPHG